MKRKVGTRIGRAGCDHPTLQQYGSTVSNWSGSHMVTFSELDGPQRCDYTHWVDEVVWRCTSCGEVRLRDSVHHERHSLCGKNY